MASKTIQSNNQYLTNDQIVVMGVMALSPIGIIGIPDFAVRRHKQAIIHLILLGIGIVANMIAGIISFATSASELGAEIHDIIFYIAFAPILASYTWSIYEGGWMLGNIETVRAQANQKN